MSLGGPEHQDALSRWLRWQWQARARIRRWWWRRKRR